MQDWLAMMECYKMHMGVRIEASPALSPKIMFIDTTQMKVDKADIVHWPIKASLRKDSLHADLKRFHRDGVIIIIAGS